MVNPRVPVVLTPLSQQSTLPLPTRQENDDESSLSSREELDEEEKQRIRRDIFCGPPPASKKQKTNTVTQQQKVSAVSSGHPQQPSGDAKSDVKSKLNKTSPVALPSMPRKEVLDEEDDTVSIDSRSSFFDRFSDECCPGNYDPLEEDYLEEPNPSFL
jgi:hypothetical protein